MTTALDSSVLLDVLMGDATFGARSGRALEAAYTSGAIVAGDIVWAEVRARFENNDSFEEAMSTLGVQFVPTSPKASSLAGALWREHRRRSAGRRDRVIADFLIGAHALTTADTLLTRDRGFYRDYFKALKVIEP
jgi:predicted nucleic acid-binding protein